MSLLDAMKQAETSSNKELKSFQEEQERIYKGLEESMRAMSKNALNRMQSDMKEMISDQRKRYRKIALFPSVCIILGLVLVFILLMILGQFQAEKILQQRILIEDYQQTLEILESESWGISLHQGSSGAKYIKLDPSLTIDWENHYDLGNNQMGLKLMSRGR